ncbi:MAG: hypothetical protein P4L46_22780 [Fimbriimonas sp.]|nr:hypothetical protein [Fimbriimonas sp.]
MALLRATLLVFFTLVGLRVVVGLQSAPDTHPPEWRLYLPAAAAVAVFVTSGIPRLVGLIAITNVILSELGVNQNTIGAGVHTRFVPWNRISSAEIWTDATGKPEHQVITFFERDLALISVAVDQASRVGEVETYLRSRGLQVGTRQ